MFFIRILEGERPSMQSLFLGTHRTNLRKKLEDRKLQFTYKASILIV